MTEYHLDPDAVLFKVRAIDPEHGVAHIRTSTGGVGTLTSGSVIDLVVGETYVGTPSRSGPVLPAPEGLWVEKRFAGVCKRVLADQVVVRIDQETRVLDRPPTLEVAEGNTVEVDEDSNILKVIDDTPAYTSILDGRDGDRDRDFKIDAATLTHDFQSFGGFDDIKRRARTLVLMPLQRAELLAKIGIKPIKGVLFTGPPGTGKTLMAKILAKESNANFYEVSGPEIFGSLYGESEQTLRSLFEDARANSPAIIFFDEIDSVASSRDGDSHEVSKRVVAQFLTLMDGFEPSANVVVIAATNRVEDLDPALRRPGRFDSDVEFRLPDLIEREAVLRACRPKSVGEDMPFQLLAERTEGWSPADLESIWTEAGLSAASDRRDFIDAVDLDVGHQRAAAEHARRSVVAAGATDA